MNKSAVLLIRNKNLISEKIIGKTLFAYIMDTLETASIETVYYCGNEFKDDRLTLVHSYKQLFNDLSEEEGRILLVDIDYPFLCPETLRVMLESEGNLVLADYVDITDVFALEKRDLNQLEELYFEQMPFHDDAEKIRISDAASLEKAVDFERRRINRAWADQGVRFVDSERVYIGRNVVLSPGVRLGLDVELLGDTRIGENSEIASFSRICNSTVGRYCRLEQLVLNDSTLGDYVRTGACNVIGPQSILKDAVAIGSFNEICGTVLGAKSTLGSHCSLNYSTVGESVRIGSGVTTIDPNIEDDEKIVIRDCAYIGNNVILVAPVNVGEIAVVAAGTTLTDDVEDGDSVIGRTKQLTRKGLGLEYIVKESKR